MTLEVEAASGDFIKRCSSLTSNIVAASIIMVLVSVGPFNSFLPDHLESVGCRAPRKPDSVFDLRTNSAGSLLPTCALSGCVARAKI